MSDTLRSDLAMVLHDIYGCRITCRGGRLADDRHPSHTEAYLDTADRIIGAIPSLDRHAALVAAVEVIRMVADGADTGTGYLNPAWVRNQCDEALRAALASEPQGRGVIDVDRLMRALVEVEEAHLDPLCISDNCNHPEGECPEYGIGCHSAAEIAAAYIALASEEE